MLRRSLLLALLVCGTTLHAQDATAPLTKEEIALVARGEVISMPMPGELFAALSKQGKPDWSAMLRKSPAGSFTSRQQIALNLGALIADGYLAVEAQDSQQVKNVSKDIKGMAKGLGVEQDLINRGNSIIEFAQSGKWDALKEELEATQNEVVTAMIAHHDQDLVTFVTLGGWLRGTEVVSGFLATHYTESGARVLRQPAVVDHFIQQLAMMPKKLTDTNVVSAIRTALFEIKKLVAFSTTGTSSVDDVKKLAELAASAVKTISTK
jgi:hypothetical protein